MNHYLITTPVGELVAYFHTADLDTCFKKHDISGPIVIKTLKAAPLITATFDPPLRFTEEMSGPEMEYTLLMASGLFKAARQHRLDSGLCNVMIDVRAEETL